MVANQTISPNCPRGCGPTTLNWGDWYKASYGTRESICPHCGTVLYLREEGWREAMQALGQSDAPPEGQPRPGAEPLLIEIPVWVYPQMVQFAAAPAICDLIRVEVMPVKSNGSSFRIFGIYGYDELLNAMPRNQRSHFRLTFYQILLAKLGIKHGQLVGSARLYTSLDQQDRAILDRMG